MKKSLLIAGESSDFQLILSAILSDDYKIFCAGSIAEVMNIIDNTMVSMIIASPKLKKNTCFELARELKKAENVNSDIPIVLATDLIDALMLSKAHKNNIVDVMKLPLEPLELEQKVIEILLKYARSYEKPDPVTGLHKKLFGEEQIEDLLDNDSKGALMMIEICRFSYASSKISDKALKACSDVLKKVVSKKAVLCVVAGGGFMLFEPSLREKEAVETYAKKLIKSLNEDSETKNLFISIGLAVTDRHGTDFKDLYLACDAGLGIARQDGRNRACFYKW